MSKTSHQTDRLSIRKSIYLVPPSFFRRNVHLFLKKIPVCSYQITIHPLHHHFFRFIRIPSSQGSHMQQQQRTFSVAGELSAVQIQNHSTGYEGERNYENSNTDEDTPTGVCSVVSHCVNAVPYLNMEKWCEFRDQSKFIGTF